MVNPFMRVHFFNRLFINHDLSLFRRATRWQIGFDSKIVRAVDDSTFGDNCHVSRHSYQDIELFIIASA